MATCNVCGKSFRNQHGLSTHVARNVKYGNCLRKGNPAPPVPLEVEATDGKGCTFCPRCGLNVRVVGKAMKLADRMGVKA